MTVQNLPVIQPAPAPRHAGCAFLHKIGVRECQIAKDGKCSEFVLRVVQPALVGLVDGSISTLAPLFATAYATQKPHIAFLIGAATSLGAGISMGMSEGLSDDGELTGRGNATLRGAITGVATFFGGIFHTLPFLLHDMHLALLSAYAVVGVELMLIAWIRFHFMETPFWKSVVQVVIGGLLVLGVGIAFGVS